MCCRICRIDGRLRQKEDEEGARLAGFSGVEAENLCAWLMRDGIIGSR